MALSIARRGYVLQTGEIVLHDTAENLKNNPLMQKAISASPKDGDSAQATSFIKPFSGGPYRTNGCEKTIIEL